MNFNILEIPPGIEPVKLTNSVIWMEDDILYSKPLPGPYILATRKQMEEDMQKFRQVSGGKKVFMIAETHPHSEQPRKEDRDFISEKLAEVARAMAILTPNAVSRMVANLFFLFKPAPFPTKMFVSVSDAKQWLKEIRKNGPKTMMFAA